jgi:hypothetical protein
MKRSLPDARLHGRATCKWIGTLSMAWGLLLSVMVLGCAGSLDAGVTGGGTGGSSGNGCQVAVLAQQCAGCHAAGSGSAGLDLASPNPETRLVGKMTSTTNGGLCGNMTLINAGVTPATGVFIDKITMATPPCGASMPYGSLPNTADTACLVSWANSIATTTAPFSGEETP